MPKVEAKILCLDNEKDFYEEEWEEPELLACVFPKTSDFSKLPSVSDISLTHRKIFGKANRLSEQHKKWQIIHDVCNATQTDFG